MSTDDFDEYEKIFNETGQQMTGYTVEPGTDDGVIITKHDPDESWEKNKGETV